jgi:hypothetical protein
LKIRESFWRTFTSFWAFSIASVRRFVQKNDEYVPWTLSNSNSRPPFTHWYPRYSRADETPSLRWPLLQVSRQGKVRKQRNIESSRSESASGDSDSPRVPKAALVPNEDGEHHNTNRPFWALPSMSLNSLSLNRRIDVKSDLHLQSGPLTSFAPSIRKSGLWDFSTFIKQCSFLRIINVSSRPEILAASITSRSLWQVDWTIPISRRNNHSLPSVSDWTTFFLISFNVRQMSAIDYSMSSTPLGWMNLESLCWWNTKLNSMPSNQSNVIRWYSRDACENTGTRSPTLRSW